MIRLIPKMDFGVGEIGSIYIVVNMLGGKAMNLSLLFRKEFNNFNITGARI